MKRGFLIGSSLAACLSLGAAPAQAAVVWVGDFETNDLSQWTYVVNGQVNGVPYAVPQLETVAEGMYAVQIELHNDAVWPNGLKRVELQHRPDAARTAEGATTFFAWSFYLPQTLPEDPSQQIGYWESNNSYQQMMAFRLRGEQLTFLTRRPMTVEQWQADVVTPAQWHRVAMSVTWSTSAAQGSVSVWFDGEQVVDEVSVQTLADNNPHFIQVGLLRDAIEFGDVPVIILDDAVEGDSLEDVRPDDLPGVGGEDSGSSDGGADSTDDGGMADTTAGEGEGEGTTGGGEPATSDPGPVTNGGTEDTGAATDDSATGGSGAEADGSDEGCSCRSGASGGGAGSSSWGLLALGLLGLRRRRHARGG